MERIILTVVLVALTSLIASLTLIVPDILKGK